RARGAKPPSEPRDEGDAVSALAAALAGTTRPEEAAELLLAAAGRLAGIDATLLALVDEEDRRAEGFASLGVDSSWWRTVEVDLEDEPSGIGTIARERAAFAVYDVTAASGASGPLTEEVGAKSAAFVPALADGRVVAALVAVSQREHRFFGAAELQLLQALADEAAPALERAHATDPLHEARARERLLTDIARSARSSPNSTALLQTALAHAGAALHANRILARLREPDGGARLASQWRREGLEEIGEAGEDLDALCDLAERERRTVSAAGAEAEDRADALLATPVGAFGRALGVLALQRAGTLPWTERDIPLVEALAGALGLAVHTGGAERDEWRVGGEGALLKAAHVVTSDLRFESVLQRLVDQVVHLFSADAADCWIFEQGQRALRCRAVYGLPEDEVGRRLAPAGTFADAIESRRPVIKREFARTEDPPPSTNFAHFEEVMVAPITWLEEVRGVLGVCSLEGGRFAEGQLEVLEAFARFASLASHNAESFEERERQAQVQQGFYRIAEVLGSPVSLPETLDALAEAAAESLGGTSSVVLEPVGRDLHLAAAYELPAPLEARLGEGLGRASTPFAPAADEERIIASTRLPDDDRFDDETRALLAEHGYASLVAAPIHRSGRPNTTVVVLFRGETSFSDDDLVLARHVSRAARGALERADMFERERRARDVAQRLADVGARLVANLDAPLVVEEVAQEAGSLLGADAAVVRLLEGDELVVRAATGRGTGGLVGTRTSSGAGLLGKVAQSRRPATVEDARVHPQAGRGDPLLVEAARSSAAVPLTAHGGRLHGVLSVYALAGRAWGPDELQALVALAAMASAALSNAWLYQRVAEERDRGEAILANIADGIVAVDREGRIVLWNAMAERITGVPGAEAMGRRVAEALQRELASERDDPVGEREVAIVRGGKEVWLSLTEAVMRDAHGAVAGR
ncbi:MAG: GAF domain-containing protein, partial [Thermoleophilia bacterium]|nr:GAF domain-containing protein [Thermoleophilia bacterium]